MIDHDKNVGAILDTIDKLGIVVYGTDNGPHMNTWPDGAMTPFRKELWYFSDELDLLAPRFDLYLQSGITLIYPSNSGKVLVRNRKFNYETAR